MSTILTAEQRRSLDSTVQKARTAAEAAAAEALHALAVGDTHRPGFLTDEQNELRLALRAKAKQLGDLGTYLPQDLTLLERDVAYEQWHRLLFARFLERNGLLMHPEYPDTPVSLQDCEELAVGEGEPDGWSLAARFAAQILPGVFRLDDPAMRVRLSTERRVELERLLMSIPADVFEAEDALGWVYQFWQTAEKKRVNDQGDKVGGADLSPVTQLFTENYMVRFLIENSLGAWWAGRHPDSPLVGEWEYLRRLDDGTPAAGTFDEWPQTAAKVTVMDPCCGSGHFLVAMFGMLWRMRAEEEGLSPAAAQDAVLRDNLFGLELDPRCTQIATFNVALEAWKQGGYRELPAPQVACSGVPVRQTREEWLDGVPDHLRESMGTLHTQFRDADTLGSLIDPRPADEVDGELFGRDMVVNVTWDELRPYLAAKFAQEGAAGSVLGHATEDVVQAARLLAGRYTLVATNPPYLKRASMDWTLQQYIDHHHAQAKSDIATAFVERCLALAGSNGTIALVSPQNWLLLKTYTELRQHLLDEYRFDGVARLGSGAFRQITGEVVKVALSIVSTRSATRNHEIAGLLAHRVTGADAKAQHLRHDKVVRPTQASQRQNPDMRITLTRIEPGQLLERFADGLQGIKTGDDPRFRRYFWEILDREERTWSPFTSSVPVTTPYSGRSYVVAWNEGDGDMTRSPSARIVGRKGWGKHGVLVSLMSRTLPVTIYTGELFDTNAAPVVPRDPEDLPAIWAYCSSPEFHEDVRELDDKLNVTNATLVKVAFDRERWQKVADEMGPLPEPHSDDPTQWLFTGDIPTSTHPLQVAVARLLGYRWPDQEPDDLDRFTDGDGIVTLPNLGEGDAAGRIRELLAAAYGDTWTATLEHTLVTEAGGKTGRLEDWLRDTFFAQHCKVFDNRPFVWHVWDGRKDGFSALLDYHRLDRPTLEKLTYTTLGTWIRQQQHAVTAGTAGAEARLAAAEELKRTLEHIIEGEGPFDVFVRWKPLHEQPIGWDPDLDDGVRLNIRPFVTAGILRSKVNVHWKKDRGKNPDGSERHNDLHPTLAERRAARAQHEADTA
ncbi:SAM-dependent DNA methyltransferase [Oerskovia turbata]|uniref:site-specific DNA-methyltransferase (adenine-specific) n=1 Tax=Oerskovia turbata TaxID=1713 RepID=A0A4Q1KZ54_9CELL|nr:N-6 DNA methylase [Oerskovia turbata]RXR27930.1 SAM-dependent DNA methyltransferase [Oerskovia turbata]RXR35632.1 SAM-dependent DNA methyltransferase [Oerskovia turbata]TGJ96610.1 SAM-dependent DNA methyltransferase [Actinotalea fermentans ATCC 43279 = JCM 9966 = DSM 3133]